MARQSGGHSERGCLKELRSLSGAIGARAWMSSTWQAPGSVSIRSTVLARASTKATARSRRDQLATLRDQMVRCANRQVQPGSMLLC